MPYERRRGGEWGEEYPGRRGSSWGSPRPYSKLSEPHSEFDRLEPVSGEGGGWYSGDSDRSRGRYGSAPGPGYGGQGWRGYGEGWPEGREEAGYRGHYGKGPRGYARSDERIREDVNDRLTDDWQVDASEIEVMVSNGEVTLSGTVSSRDEKRRAEDLAENVSGVRHVQNNLRIQRGPAAVLGGVAAGRG